jgi:hypothetical protein
MSWLMMVTPYHAMRPLLDELSVACLTLVDSLGGTCVVKASEYA